jgi:phosphoribosylanthranilate isomerase
MKVKICGLRNEEDIRKTIELGAWALGFIFYEKSPRFISPEVVGKITRSYKIERVGVFVNEPISKMIEFQKKADFQTLQLHGEEGPEVLSKIDSKFRIIKKLNPKDLDNIDLFLKAHPKVSFLIDAPPSFDGLYGGRGEISDWDFARAVKKKIGSKGKLILAGGLGQGNMAMAKREVNPFAFDLSSSVESAPGIKDHKKLEKLFSMIQKEILS